MPGRELIRLGKSLSKARTRNRIASRGVPGVINDTERASSLKNLIAGGILIAWLLTGGIPFARGGAPSISNGTLQDTYVLEASGFSLNDFDAKTSMGHTGEVAALGLVRLDGNGGLKGTVNFTSADSGSDQAPCSEKVTGTYDVTNSSGPGTGTLTITFPPSKTACPGPPLTSSGTLHFDVVVRPDGRVVRLLESDSGANLGNVTICCEPIATQVLTGHLEKVTGPEAPED